MLTSTSISSSTQPTLTTTTLYRIGLGAAVDHINNTYPAFYLSSRLYSLKAPTSTTVERSIDGGNTWHEIATWERNKLNGWSLKLKYEG